MTSAQGGMPSGAIREEIEKLSSRSAQKKVLPSDKAAQS
jgi:hypothetical protein